MNRKSLGRALLQVGLGPVGSRSLAVVVPAAVAVAVAVAGAAGSGRRRVGEHPNGGCSAAASDLHRHSSYPAANVRCYSHIVTEGIRESARLVRLGREV